MLRYFLDERITYTTTYIHYHELSLQCA